MRDIYESDVKSTILLDVRVNLRYFGSLNMSENTCSKICYRAECHPRIGMEKRAALVIINALLICTPVAPVLSAKARRWHGMGMALIRVVSS